VLLARPSPTRPLRRACVTHGCARGAPASEPSVARTFWPDARQL
jgi:hypothetical protein